MGKKPVVCFLLMKLKIELETQKYFYVNAGYGKQQNRVSEKGFEDTGERG